MNDIDLIVGGITPLTSIDFPDHLSAVVIPRAVTSVANTVTTLTFWIVISRGGWVGWKSLALLERRKGLLDAVVFSGGEPTVQKALVPALEQVRSLGFATGLHTAGTAPTRLQQVLPLLDWVGLDIKALPEDYPMMTGVDVGKNCWQSLDRLLASGISFEVRTTAHWQLLPPEKLLNLAECLSQRGVQRFVVQDCRTDGCLNSQLPPTFCEPGKKQSLFRQLENLFPSFEVR